ncbi:hypothetical protein Hypma_014420 [Hypsizygus marmoreus]|uniref:Ubiquitin-like protease family profile domain-containing protein n=1 Tax=Hypsizygus marmoreus TaxID=39966 RepID=A0A369JAB3_HYPMA|nr:hypothetical protein Hypma_014420 [Hypsizygus marmoreus]
MGKKQTRSQQAHTGGLGKQFTSPVKRHDSRKTRTLVQPAGHADKKRCLEEHMASLKGRRDLTPTPSPPILPSEPDEPPQVHSPADNDADQSDPVMEVDPDLFSPPNKRRTVPDQTTSNLYDTWQRVLPRLVDPLLAYIQSTTGRVLQPPASRLQATCHAGCTPKTSKITCLYFDHFQATDVEACSCQSTLQTLLQHGLFPTSPTHPRMAISVAVLDFYQALFERSCDAVNAMAAVLNNFYTRRGYIMLNRKGERIQEPFRRGLGYAIQWYDNLQIHVEQRINDALLHAEDQIQSHDKSDGVEHNQTTQPPLTPPTTPSRNPTIALPAGSSPSATSPTVPPVDSSAAPPAPQACPPANPQSPPKASSAPAYKSSAQLSPGKCARILQQRCPACFAGTRYGRSFDELVFPTIYLSLMLLICMLEAGTFNCEHIDSLRTKKPKKYTPKVPDESVDDCKSSYTAGNGANSKTNMEKFDDSGVMALVCRHDIPIFLANIDTPGEQQKYAVALIQHLYSFVPPEATVAILYDVACVLDRSLAMYDILPPDITSRLQFATAAMHAYGHEWPCQLIFNPRLWRGLGLTDGEGVERLWSRLRKLIGITRASSRRKRLYLLDRQAAAIATELRDDLGDWIRRRLLKGVKQQGEAAQHILDTCGVSVEELRRQWAMQQEAQLSVRAHAPVRLKKELDTVLTLQGDLDTVASAIDSARSVISQSTPSTQSLQLLKDLQASHDDLQDQVEVLYASLNVHDSFPELQGIDLEFIRTLLMARDLKINIRKRAIGSFFEWDKLDQAAGGREQSIGTKLHQHTRKAIAKRKPALMSAIRKFNRYCEKLADLHQPHWSIPLPEPLPIQLSPLRDCPHLMEDVWITPLSGQTPRWLEDVDVREGIRALQKVDRCQEERRRLGVEADNLCRWFGRELRAVEVAIANPSNRSIMTLLQQLQVRLMHLKPRWTNPLASAARFDSHVRTATHLATSIHPTTPRVAPTSRHDSYHVVKPLSIAGLGEEGEEYEVEEPSIEDLAEPRMYPSSDEVVLADFLLSPEEADEPTSTEQQASDSNIDFSITVPAFVTYDSALSAALTFQSVGEVTISNSSRALHVSGQVIVFDARELTMFRNPTARLNDVCINGGAAYLQTKFSHPSNEASRHAERCAIFSTHHLRMARYHTDEEMWRRTASTMYWLRDVWILPIHRRCPEHWVLCVIYPERRQLLLFDSLGQVNPWRHQVKEIMQFVTRLVLAAN